MANRLSKQHTCDLGGITVGGDNPVYVICEGGVTNYGELEIAKRQVDAAYEAGVDAIKFQVTITEDLVSKVVADRLEGELGYNWFDRVKYKEFTFDEVRELARYVATGGMPFFATAHDVKALDFLDKELDIPYFKIGSGESHNYDFLSNVGRRGKPVIISFGLQTDEEMVRAVETLRDAGTTDIVALHCTTVYPTPYEQVDLTRMLHIEELLGVPVGISDHSIGYHVVLAAIGMGACVVEKHITFGKNDPRSLDNAGALFPQEWREMTAQIRDIEAALKPLSAEQRAKNLEKPRDWAGQSIVAAHDLPAGLVLKRQHVEFKRPGKGGMSPNLLNNILDKKLTVSVPADEQLKHEHFE